MLLGEDVKDVYSSHVFTRDGLQQAAKVGTLYGEDEIIVTANSRRGCVRMKNIAEQSLAHGNSNTRRPSKITPEGLLTTYTERLRSSDHQYIILQHSAIEHLSISKSAAFSDIKEWKTANRRVCQILCTREELQLGRTRHDIISRHAQIEFKFNLQIDALLQPILANLSTSYNAATRFVFEQATSSLPSNPVHLHRRATRLATSSSLSIVSAFDRMMGGNLFTLST
ncbi:hypothetical protein EV421DRAFT_1740059 [Armillaria borealis]|uniref:Uncharacterized protein n=1 Tax=Armillaria borealis TaxID=47425 RepID=A0AA39MI14_9AGAR|nr:hypothetical protein EV421DRAFT_1740059 [Armillaria borealis]